LHDPAALRADIRVHLEAENAYTRAMLASTEALQAELFDEMKGRIKPDDASVPTPDGQFEYFVRYEPGAQHPLHLRRYRSPAAKEEVLIDADALSKGKAYFNLAHAEHSPDHSLYAYAADEQGSEIYRVCVKSLAAGEVLAEPIEQCTGDFCWSQDSDWLFWIWRDAEGRPAKVFRRPAKGGAQDDVLVYEEPDDGFFLHVHRSSSGAFIVIGAGNHETSETWLIPCSDPTSAPRVVEPRQAGVLYDLEHWGDRFVVRTNADGAVDFKLMWADEADPSKSSWREFVAHRPGRLIEGVTAFSGHLVRSEISDAVDRIVITERGSLAEHAIAFDEEAYALGIDGGYEYDTQRLRFVYQSPTTPRQWFDYHMDQRTRILLKTQEIPSGHDPERYVVRRLNARASDGASIPITVLHRRSTAVDGTAPLLLYGYGAYGLSMPASFSITRLSLVDRGWIFAIAHIRGGSEKGRGWFLDGRRFKKKNSFTDFVASADHLIESGYGQAGRIVAQGGSAGGMLMGAVANLRPDIFAGIVAEVPFVDVLNTISDEDLPLTPPEWPEWGDPIRDREAYDYIASYSPYDNVAPRAYPAILATGGLSDPRVTYWEPAKWVARLREAGKAPRPVLLKMNMDAGHGGASGRFDHLKDPALAFAFAIWAMERAP
ncbi:MAG TPA: S9 family peptidase, partial [Caulobacteraceae bacterium]|nr:S9 family peptidase [Caulobacteraceae bacterium]